MLRTTVLIGAIAASLLLSLASHAAGKQVSAAEESTAYCAYRMESAKADSTLLQSAQLQTSSGKPQQEITSSVAVGVVKSVSRDLKGRLVMAQAEQDCTNYQARTVILHHLNFAMADAQRAAEYARQTSLQTAIADFEALRSSYLARLKAKGVTLFDVNAIDLAGLKLKQELVQSQSLLASLNTGQVASLPTLQSALQEELGSRNAARRLLVKIARQDNWDVVFSAGAQKSNAAGQTTAAFGAITWTYSFGTNARNLALDAAASAQQRFEDVHSGELHSRAHQLQQSLTAQMEAARSQQMLWQHHMVQADAQLLAIANENTDNVARLRLQLTLENLLIKSQAAAARAQEAWLGQYLNRNFSGAGAS